MASSWREHQRRNLAWYACHIPNGYEVFLGESEEDDIDEDTTLGLPSDLIMSTDLIDDHGIRRLIGIESSLRLAEAQEALGGVRRMVKMISATWDNKAVNSRGGTQNRRSQSNIDDLTDKRDRHMETYNTARKVLILLSEVGDCAKIPKLPLLSEADTKRRAPQGRRQPGDSRHEDGPLWGGSIGSGSASVAVRAANPRLRPASTEYPVLTSQSRRAPSEPINLPCRNDYSRNLYSNQTTRYQWECDRGNRERGRGGNVERFSGR